MEFVFFLSLFFCLMSYLNSDPIKSCFFLIFCMLFCLPVMVFYNYSWFSYFICMLFLSGIFVILVYFSSLSSFLEFKPYFYFWGFFLTLLFFVGDVSFVGLALMGLNFFYYGLNFFLMFYIIFFLLFFMNFVSYCLSFSGALRSV